MKEEVMYIKKIVGWELLNPADRECSPEVPVYEYVPVKRRKTKKK